MRMEVDFSLSEAERRRLIAAVKVGIYQELLENGLLEKDRAGRLIARARLAISEGDGPHAGK